MEKSKEEGASNERIAGHTVGGRNNGRALNPLRHGGFLRAPVIPDVESLREFRRFQSKIREALAPRNALQREIADRIAGAAWRLRRVEPFEAAVIARGQQKAEEELTKAAGLTNLHWLERFLKMGRSHLEFLVGLPTLAPETIVKRRKALDVLGFVADFAGVKLEDVVDLSAETVIIADTLRRPFFKDWTSTEILEAIAAIARRTDKVPEGLRQAAILHLMMMLMFSEAEAKDVFAARDHQRRLHLLPDSNDLDRLLRYEAHVWKQFVRALHEYEALQARDRGERVPLARLDVEGLS
jgi:hypothetical protein